MDKCRKIYYKTSEVTVKKMIVVMLCFILVMMFGVTALHMPHQIKFLTDLMLIAMTFLSLGRLLTMIRSGSCRIFWLIAFFFLYVMIIYFFGERNLLYFITGVRQNFRHYLFFLVCSCWIEKKDIEEMLRIFEVMLYINAIVCTIQYWGFHMPFDNINGLFGTTTQGSGYLNILMIIVTTFGITKYMEKCISGRHLLAILAGNVWIAIITETKAYYFELIAIIGLVIFMYMRKDQKKKLLMTVAACAGGLILIQAFTVYFKPEYWSNFFSPMGVWEEMTRKSGYSGSGDLNRLTAIPTIFKDIFHGGSRSLIGFGLGNCESSGPGFASTPFYDTYQNLHYMWFSISMLLLEIGFIGLLLYNLFFVFIAGKAWTQWHSQVEDEKWMSRAVFTIALCCFLLQIYNISLKNESGFMIFYILSIPYALSKKETRRTE